MSATAPLEPVYCMDTSSYIEMARRYPRPTFDGLWVEMERLMDSRRLVSPREVYRELVLGSDDLAEWVRQRRNMFPDVDPERARGVIARFPRLVDPDKETPDADPFVVALALPRREDSDALAIEVAAAVVVTQERPGSPDKPGIPYVCKWYGIGCIAVLDLFRREDWRF